MKINYHLLITVSTLLIILINSVIFAQAPDKISYQAVIRNSSNQLITNQTISMQIRIIKDTASGLAEYIETHTPVTNANGLVSIEIGAGNATFGSFSGINWANGPYFIKTETDPAGGTLYSIIGISQLLSVPYALHAKTAETVIGGSSEIDPVFTAWDKDYTDLINKPNIADTINTYGFSGNYNDLVNQPVLFDGNYNNLTNKPNIHDSILAYSSGNDYNNLINKPNIADSIALYGFDGNYNNLTNKPLLFDSNYFNLHNLPDFQDSIALYGFSGNYNDLTNKPDIADSIALYGFDGDYNNLTNKPILFDSNYFSLHNLPDFQDSIAQYGFSGNYNDLSNKPDIADSITLYGFDGDYNNLTNLPLPFDSNYFSLHNLPDFQDSISIYGFNGDYNSLSNQPALFDGNYNNLTNKPNIADSISSKAVLLTGNQTIQGNKTFTGTISASNQKITNVANPVNNSDAANKAYVDMLLDRIMELQAEIGVTDIDGNKYGAVKINNQVWMSENLRTTRYKDGNPINPVTSGSAWETQTSGAYCWYDNDSVAYAVNYGALYNWFAVNTQKLCPKNWHVPSQSEINVLINYLGGSGIAGGKLKSTRTQPVTHPRWDTPNTGATDEAGFRALPGGYREYDGSFNSIGSYAYWWSATADDTENSFYLGVIYNNVITTFYPYLNTLGFSVRCIRDN